VCRKAIAHKRLRCAPPAKLSKADWKTVRAHQKMLQIEHKLAKEKRRDERLETSPRKRRRVTEQFCAAVRTR